MSEVKCLKHVVDTYNGAPLDEAKQPFIDVAPLGGPEASVTKMYKCSESGCEYICGVMLVGRVFNATGPQEACVFEQEGAAGGC